MTVEYLFIAILSAILFASTMKVADLFNEHGLKGFRGVNIIFGVFWGVFGALLLLTDSTVANIVFAMNIAFITRGRLDFLNHQIATSIIIIVFLFSTTFQPLLFLTFYIVFVVFGSLRDYIDKIFKQKGILYYVNESMLLYYPIPTLIYSIVYNNYSVFIIFLIFTISYDLTKYIAYKKGYK
jgi:hypothetical protein